MTRARLLAGRTFHSLRVRNYRLFFLGQLVSLIGTWMQVVAQNWLVLELTRRSAVALSVTVALQFLPMLLLGLWGGVIADRFDKRRVLVWTQLASGALALVLWALVATGAVELWMVYVLAVGLGLVNVVDMPTRQAFVTEMVGPDDVVNAVGLNGAVFNSARLVGPAVAGLVIYAVGVAPAFLINAFSYLAPVVGLLAMRRSELHTLSRLPREPGQVRAGLQYVRERPELWSTLALLAVVSTLGFNFLVVLPLMAKLVFHGGARLYGNIQAVMAGGSLFGALAAAGRARPTRGVLLGSAVAFGALSLGAALAPNPLIEAITLVPLGASTMVFIVTANTTMQLNSDAVMRGRVMALYGLVFLGSTPLGSPLIGWISQQWGTRVGLGFGGAASLAAALVAIATIRIRAVRHPALETIPETVPA